VEYEAFVQRVTDQAQFEGYATAVRAIEATLHTLAQSVPVRVAEDVARKLPPEMAAVVRGARGAGVANLADFYGRIGRRAELSLSRGLEQAQIVCAVLAEQLDPTLLGRMMRELPDDIASLLVPLSHAQSAPTVSHVGHGATLSDGKPGASHPLSEASPGSRHPVSEAAPHTAHTHSVLEAAPHQDSKISSAPGLTQEREHDTLAEGRSKRS
jgi:uncharacterized protein (DUF2267 family)